MIRATDTALLQELGLRSREVYEIQVCVNDDGTCFADLFATTGDFAGMCIVSTGDHHASRFQAMLDLAYRLYGEERD